jgi:hypothetical protein
MVNEKFNQKKGLQSKEVMGTPSRNQRVKMKKEEHLGV